MELAKATRAIRKLELPPWVLDRIVVEDLNADNDPLVRVRLKVADDFDVNAHYDELMKIRERILETIWDSEIPDSTPVSFGITDDAPTV